MNLFKKKKNPQTEFKLDLAETESFKTMLKTQSCPGCGQTTLILRSYERVPEGFEAQVHCTNCPGLHGIVNEHGFSFTGLIRRTTPPMPIVSR